MAISWGTEVKNSSGNGMRLGYEFSQSPSSVGTGTSSVTVTLRVYFWSRNSVSDSTNSYSISGDFDASGSANISHGSGGGQTLIRTLTRTVSTSYANEIRSKFSASITGINAISGTASVGGSWYTGKRPVSKPANVTGASASRVSDTRHTVSWTNHPSTSAPYDSVTVDRWDNVRNEWYAVVTLRGSVSSYTDSSTVANRRYRYRVMPRNAAGWADDRSYTGYLTTTQTPPSSVTATKSGSDIKVAWKNNDTAGDAVEVWHASDGVWEGTRLALLTGSPSSWVHTSPNPAVTHTYKLKARSSEPTIYSGFGSASNTVQLLAPPSAPTKLTPSAVAIDATEDIALAWRHNSVDTTAQAFYELEYRVNGGAWVGSGKVASESSSRILPADTVENGAAFEWHVRTWGDHASASAWSQIATITMSARPAVTIDAPVGVVESSRVTAVWSYFDPESTIQTAARLRLLDATGAEVWGSTLTTAATEHLIPYTVADGAAYTLAVSVRDGSGLWSVETSETFSVLYAKPPSPLIEAVWDLGLGGVVVSIEHPEPVGAEVAAISAELWRASGDDWELVAADLEPTTSIVDFIPALDTVNYYRVVSVSALPSYMESVPVEVLTDSGGWVFVNGGPGFSQVARIRRQAQPTHSPTREKTLNHFAGRKFAVETSGEARSRSITLSGMISDESSSNADWEAMSDLAAPLCYREPAINPGVEPSTRLFVSFSGYSVSKEMVYQTVQMSFEQVEGV